MKIPRDYSIRMGGKDMKDIILITGGLGFIGKQLSERVKEEFPEYKVVVLDQHIRDYDDYIRSDISNFGELYYSINRIEGNIKYIIHAASEVGRINGEEHPWKMIDSCVMGTLNLINVAIENDAKFIYFSTSEVYGDAFDDKEVKEDDMLEISPLILNNIYSISKLFGESLVKHYVKNYGLKGITIRPFMVYGPGVFSNKYKSALDIFIWNLLNDREIIVHEDSVRSWCYIDDFVDALVLIIKNHNFISKQYEAYNVGNNQEYKTMEELAYYIADVLKVNKDLIRIEKFDGKFKSQKKYFSTHKLEQYGFKHRITIEEGIKKMIQWHKSIIEKGDKL